MTSLPPLPASSLSLRQLEELDPRAPGGGAERRFLCPLCGDGKPKDGAHRSLCANVQSGAWNCKRCGASGKLRDFWQERPAPVPRRERALQALRQAFFLPSHTSADKRRENARATADTNLEKAACKAAWRAQLKALQHLRDTPGTEYLTGRSIACDLAHLAGVRYSRAWFGRPAVVFPVRDFGRILIGAQGRYVDGRDNPKARTAGTVGAFATSDARGAEVIALVEAPLDALSLAMCGIPAVAMMGCNLPAWAPRACAFRRVLIATDADAAGDAAALQWASVLASMGARCQRLRPEGGKDWNEILCGIGAPALRELLAMQT